MSGRAFDTWRAQSAFGPWLMAVRPRTLGIAASPVIVGTALAVAHRGHADGALFALTLVAALLIQAGANLHNDAADEKADCVGRLGPPRVSATGLLSARRVRRAAWLMFVLAALAGAWLVAEGGWPIFAAGVLSIAAGAAYSAGPWPISHSPLGELFVIVFFGVIGVAGSCWLQTHALSAAGLVAGLIVGMPAAAVLLVNNTRDVGQDAASGRRTLAILIGRRRAAVVYGGLLLTPYLLLPGLATASGRMPWPALLTLPYGLWLTRRFAVAPVTAFNDLLADTAKLQFALAALLALALLQ